MVLVFEGRPVLFRRLLVRRLGSVVAVHRGVWPRHALAAAPGAPRLWLPGDHGRRRVQRAAVWYAGRAWAWRVLEVCSPPCAERGSSTVLVISLTVVGVPPAKASGTFLDAMRSAVATTLGLSTSQVAVEAVLNSTTGAMDSLIVFDIEVPLLSGLVVDRDVAHRALEVAMEDGSFMESLASLNSSVPIHVVLGSVRPVVDDGRAVGLQDTLVFHVVVSTLAVALAVAVFVVVLRMCRRQLAPKNPNEQVVFFGVVPPRARCQRSAPPAPAAFVANPMWRRR